MELRQSVEINEWYQAYRPLLFGIAYRMVASVADSEDLVQDVFLQLQHTDTTQIQNPKAYLCKVTTHRCLDLLKSHRRQREVYVGPWLPEPLVTQAEGEVEDPSEFVIRDETLSFAFLKLLDQLTPVERAVFLLREAFSYDYDEIATILEKSESNCRKIMSRVRSKLNIDGDSTVHNVERSAAYVQAFHKASQTGQMDGFIQLLADDVVLYSDGGGVVRAATRPVQSRDRVVQFMLGLFKQAVVQGYQTDTREIFMNGERGIALLVDGKLTSILAFHVRGDVIQSVYMVRNPLKLQSASRELGIEINMDI